MQYRVVLLKYALHDASWVEQCICSKGLFYVISLGFAIWASLQIWERDQLAQYKVLDLDMQYIIIVLGREVGGVYTSKIITKCIKLQIIIAARFAEEAAVEHLIYMNIVSLNRTILLWLADHTADWFAESAQFAERFAESAQSVGNLFINNME